MLAHRLLRAALLAIVVAALAATDAAAYKVYGPGASVAPNGTTFTLVTTTRALIFSDGAAMNDRCGSSTISATIADNGATGNAIRARITGWALANCTYPTSVSTFLNPFLRIDQGLAHPYPGTLGDVVISIGSTPACNLFGSLTTLWTNGVPTTVDLSGTLAGSGCGPSSVTLGRHAIASVNTVPGANLTIAP